MSAARTPVRWGVVGAGWVTRDFMLPALAADPDAELVGVVDTDPAALSALGDLPVPSTTRLADLLAEAPDAVYVATPHHAHAAAVAAVAGHGVAVLCEKPLAHDLADARRLVAAAHDAGVLAAVAFDQRFHPAHARIAEMVARGELGTVTAVRVVYGCWLPPRWRAHEATTDDNWRVDGARSGGGAVADLAPHGLDLAGCLLGEDVTSLSTVTTTRVHDYAVDDGAVLAGRTDSGVLFSSHVSFSTADPLPRRRLEVVGTAAQAVAVDTLGQVAGGTLTVVDAATGASGDVPFDRTAGPFARQVAAFGAAVGGRAPWPHPIERDLALHELLLSSLSPVVEEGPPCP